jgi:gamma-glutamyl hydrolase
MPKTRKNKIGKSKTAKPNKLKAKDTFVIGIITVPLSPNKKYFKVCGDSYIASSHLKWIKKRNIEYLPIPYDAKNLKWYFERIQGLYLPSGGAFAGTQKTYYKACKTLLEMAIKENDRGYYFPVWGCCMGFQQMLIIADGNDNLTDLLGTFNSLHNFMINIDLTEDGKHSRIIRGLDEESFKKLTRQNSTTNNHKMGISPEEFEKNKKISAFYKNVGSSVDKDGNPFVAIIEARDYPFYGVQWHPERNAEWDAFIEFFIKEMNRNRRPVKKIPRNKTLKSKRINCFNYSEGLYNKCTFFWHKPTSAHNKAMCSYAQLKKINPNSNMV